jgi:hypothetical protein
MHDHHHRGNGHRHPGHDAHHHHEDRDHHGHDGVSGYGLIPAAGHNAAAQLAQWQEPHRHPGEPGGQPEPDFDLVEATFAENFPRASDPTSFLRLARIPFVGRQADGRTLRLLRVEYEEATDVGSVTPQVGGGTLRYDPLPAQMVSTRKRLRFVYEDAARLVRLTLGEARTLAEAETA